MDKRVQEHDSYKKRGERTHPCPDEGIKSKVRSAEGRSYKF